MQAECLQVVKKTNENETLIIDRNITGRGKVEIIGKSTAKATVHQSKQRPLDDDFSPALKQADKILLGDNASNFQYVAPESGFSIVVEDIRPVLEDTIKSEEAATVSNPRRLAFEAQEAVEAHAADGIHSQGEARSYGIPSTIPRFG